MARVQLFFLQLLLLQLCRPYQRPLTIKRVMRAWAAAASSSLGVVTTAASEAMDAPKAKRRMAKGSKEAKEWGARMKALKYESSIVLDSTEVHAPKYSKAAVVQSYDEDKQYMIICFVKSKAMALRAECEASMEKKNSYSPFKSASDMTNKREGGSAWPNTEVVKDEKSSPSKPATAAIAMPVPMPLSANAKVMRELGSYEKLLSRKTPGLSTVSLSHSSVFLFPSVKFDHNRLMSAIGKVVQAHPLLRCGIRAMRGSLYFVDYQRREEEIVSSAYRNVSTSPEGFEGTWREAYTHGLNAAEFPEEGPLWKLTHVISPTQCAFVFSMNHGVDDQSSVNIIMADILRLYDAPASMDAAPKAFPPPIERAVAGNTPLTIQTLLWAAFQSLNSLLLPSMLPDSVAMVRGTARMAMAQPEARKTFCEFVRLSKDETSELVAMCKANGLTVTNLLSALILISTSDLIQDEPVGVQQRSLNLRFLLSVGLRAFGGELLDKTADFTDKSVACASGAVDFVVPVLGSVARKYCDASSVSCRADLNGLLSLGRSCARRGDEIINKWSFVPESVRLFDLGFKLVDILQAVEIEARNPASLGRGYSCGVSNMGVVSLDESSSKSLPVPVAGFYATSHGRNGVLAQLSCMTINGQFNGCLQFTDPIVSIERAALFREKFEALIRRVLFVSKL